MILNNCTYEEVLNLIINGHSYRYISDTFGISTTTVFNMSKRFKKSGSPYPPCHQKEKTTESRRTRIASILCF